ncbi:MAG: hypothetical protein RR540_03805 [Oscillospiraceae bacterium]
MNNAFFEFLKEFCDLSTNNCLIADKDFRIIYTNDTAANSELLGQNALMFFAADEKIPTENGFVSGMLSSYPYIYKIVIFHKEEDYYLVDLLTTNAFTCFFKLEAFKNFYSTLNAQLRQSIFGIVNSASVLVETLDAEECYNEIQYLNILMGNCYRILDCTVLSSETIHYIEGVSNATFNLSDYFHNFEEIFQQVYPRSKSDLEFYVEDNLFINAEEERLTYAIVNAIAFLCKKNPKNPAVSVDVKNVAGEILIHVHAKTNFAETKEHILSQVFTYGNEEINENLSLYILKRFTDEYGGKLYLRRGSNGDCSIGIRLPLSKDKKTSTDFKSKMDSYGDNRFSPIHIGFAEIFNIEYF